MFFVLLNYVISYVHTKLHNFSSYNNDDTFTYFIKYKKNSKLLIF